eukprot:gene5632-9448_t
MSDSYYSYEDQDGFSVNYFEERGGKASSGITGIATCFGCTIPLVLIICGAVLVSDPQNKASIDGVRVAYYVVGFLSACGICCQLCCISFFQFLICFKCIKDVLVSDSDSISSKVVKDIGDNLIQTLQWLLSCWNLIGPIMLISLAGASASVNANIRQIGIISIVFGCLFVVLNV